MRTDVGISHVEVTDDLRRAALMEGGGQSLMGGAESEQEMRKWRECEDSISKDALL